MVFQRGGQPADDDLSAGDSVSDAIELTNVFDRLCNQQPPRAGNRVVLPDRREIPIRQIRPRRLRQVAYTECVEIHGSMYDPSGRQEV